MITKEQAIELKKQYEEQYQQLEAKLDDEDKKEDLEINQIEYQRLEGIEEKLANKLDNLDTIIDAYDEIAKASAEFSEY